MPRIKRIMSTQERSVRVKLAERGMAVCELCERVGCSPQYLWLMLSGARSGEKYWAAICRELELPRMGEMDKEA